MSGVTKKESHALLSSATKLIACYLERHTPEWISGEIELDKSEFGGVRKGKRGREQVEKFPSSAY